MKQFVQRAGGRIGLWGGLLAAALAAFAAGWLVPARAPVGCKLNELTAAPDFSPFSPAAPAVATSDAGTPAAPSLPEKWVCLTFDDGPSKTTPEVLAALDAAGVHGTFFVVATGYNEKYLPLLTQAAAAGHQIALHSASHEYSDIYRSSAAYWKDIALLKQRHIYNQAFYRNACCAHTFGKVYPVAVRFGVVANTTFITVHSRNQADALIITQRVRCNVIHFAYFVYFHPAYLLPRLFSCFLLIF